MIRLGLSAVCLAGLLASGVTAACTSNLLIDDFTLWTSGVNNLDWENGDDGTMEWIAASPGQVVFVPRGDDSYFYESFDCQQAVTNGYGGIQFTVEGPAGASLAVELQTKENCDNGREGPYKSSYNIVSDLTGQRQAIKLPLQGFDNDPNYDAIIAIVWSGFEDTGEQWSIGNVTLICGDPGTGTSPPQTTAVPTRSTIPATSIEATTSSVATSQSATCSNLLIDDWVSQSRLTFLNYNAMGESSSDDGSMASVVVSGNRLQLTPRDRDSYLYSEFGCLNTNDQYGGVSFRISAARGTSFSVTLAWREETCGGRIRSATLSSAQLGWSFDGSERLYSFPFSAFSGVDTTKLHMVELTNFNDAVVLGPMSFYCGSTASEYHLPTGEPTSPPITRPTTPAPAQPTQGLVIDDFADIDTNALGEWHGADEGMELTFGNGAMTIRTNDSDLAWYSQLTDGCADLRPYAGGYLHIAYSGSIKFSVALQQHNSRCDEGIAPFPETWDSLEAARYASGGGGGGGDVYIPINHFNVNLTRVVGFSLKGFYTADPTTLTKLEIVPTLPAGWPAVPPKLASGRLVFACTRPDSFAFAIDDGEPALAPRVVEILQQADIPVTFFTVGLPLLDESNGLAALYRDMAARGHQIALHSYTHPPMEGLPDEASIDWEYVNDIGAVQQVFSAGAGGGGGGGGAYPPINQSGNYFRPPFGTEGARMRQRLAATLGDPEPYIVGWSVDVEDWLWAESDTPERQLDAFERDLAKGGNLVVMHYLYESTVELLPEFIRLAKASGKRLMRVDQCLEDPRAPPL